MANKKLGFVPVYRSVQKNMLWTSSEPFDSRSAWIDLLLSVNHEEQILKIGQSARLVRPGQMWTSYVKLANRWKWSRERVYRYIKLLKSEKMVTVDATPKGTLLTLVNYEMYALRGNTNETTVETSTKTPCKTSTETSTETQTIMIDNIDNDLKHEKEGRRLPPPSGGGEWQ